MIGSVFAPRDRAEAGVGRPLLSALLQSLAMRYPAGASPGAVAPCISDGVATLWAISRSRRI